MNPGPLDIAKSRIAVVMNTASGSCDASAEGIVESILKDSGLSDFRIWCTDAAGMGASFKEALQTDPAILIVLGGDGTIRTGAELCTSAGPLLIPLPGGTMNMLPKALYGTRSWQEALRDTLADPVVKSVSGGEVSGKRFYIAAIVGAPALWAKAREALREGDLQSAVGEGVNAFQQMFASKVMYSFREGERDEAAAVAIICPLISDVLNDSAPSFEAAAVSLESAGDVLALASSGAVGKWREDDHVAVTKTKTVSASAEEDIPVILDGESVELGREVEITFVPEAFKALVSRAQ